MRGSFILRTAGLVAVGSLALHQGSYWLGVSGQGSLGGHGHGYLPLVAALAMVLLALACASFTRSLWRASRGLHDEPPTPSFPALWAIFAAALLAAFGLQEWIESWVAPGHPAGPTHVLGHVGWVGLVLALLLSGAIAALLSGAESAIAFVALRHASLPRERPASGRGFPLPSPALKRADVLAGNCAERAPPITISL